MKIVLNIDITNKAFDLDRDAEISRILRQLADSIFRHGLGNNLRQPIVASNTETVGDVKVLYNI